jgi:hypothetical protein
VAPSFAPSIAPTIYGAGAPVTKTPGAVRIDKKPDVAPETLKAVEIIAIMVSEVGADRVTEAFKAKIRSKGMDQLNKIYARINVSAPDRISNIERVLQENSLSRHEVRVWHKTGARSGIGASDGASSSNANARPASSSNSPTPHTAPPHPPGVLGRDDVSTPATPPAPTPPASSSSSSPPFTAWPRPPGTSETDSTLAPAKVTVTRTESLGEQRAAGGTQMEAVFSSHLAMLNAAVSAKLTESQRSRLEEMAKKQDTGPYDYVMRNLRGHASRGENSENALQLYAELYLTMVAAWAVPKPV